MQKQKKPKIAELKKSKSAQTVGWNSIASYRVHTIIKNITTPYSPQQRL